MFLRPESLLSWDVLHCGCFFSLGAAENAMLYSYRNVFNGFSAHLSAEEFSLLSGKVHHHPGPAVRVEILLLNLINLQHIYIPWILNHHFHCSWWIFPSKQRFQHEACIHQSCIQICQRLYQFLRAEWADCIPHTLGSFLVWRPEMAASPKTHCGEKLSLELM